jgi:hypothetical protein
MKNDIKNLTIARELKDQFLNQGLISDVTSYDDVFKNVHLMAALFKEFQLQLATKIENSIYGAGKVTDFELLSTNTDQELNDLLKSKNIDSIQLFQLLKSNRKKLRGFVDRTRKSLIYDMGLPETPANKSNKKKKTVAETQEAKNQDYENGVTHRYVHIWYTNC